MLLIDLTYVLERTEMATVNREEVTILADSVLLARLRKLASEDGRDLEALFEDALRMYIKLHSARRGAAGSCSAPQGQYRTASASVRVTCTMTLQFLTVGHVIHIHDELIREFGGAFGVRDYGALESAISRPQTGYYESFSSRGRCFDGEPLQQSPFCGWQQANCNRSY